MKSLALLFFIIGTFSIPNQKAERGDMNRATSQPTSKVGPSGLSRAGQNQKHPAAKTPTAQRENNSPTGRPSPDGEARYLREIKSALERTVHRILKDKKLCPQGKNSCILLSFWDFDGTILRGDCSEGLRIKEKKIYSGLVELAIEAGLSKKFGRGEFQKFWKKYKKLEETDRLEAYLLLAQIFSGNKKEKIINFARKYFNSIYKNYYFKSSIELLKFQRELGIKNFIISASPNFFVRGAASTVGIPAERIFGIQLGEGAGGKLCEDPVTPVTYGEGKAEKLREIVAAVQKKNPGKKVFVVSAFGNSYGTDGPFLCHVLQKTHLYQPVVVMINGGPPPERFSQCAGEMLRVKFTRTTGSK